MQSMYYVGLDVRKKTISYCIKDVSGRVHAEGSNRPTLAVARKLVAYLVAVDRRQKEFVVIETENRTAA